MMDFPGHTDVLQGEDMQHGLPKEADRPDSTQEFQSLMGDERKWGIVEMMLFSENEWCMCTGSSVPNRCSFAA